MQEEYLLKEKKKGIGRKIPNTNIPTVPQSKPTLRNFEILEGYEVIDRREHSSRMFPDNLHSDDTVLLLSYIYVFDLGPQSQCLDGHMITLCIEE